MSAVSLQEPSTTKKSKTSNMSSRYTSLPEQLLRDLEGSDGVKPDAGGDREAAVYVDVKFGNITSGVLHPKEMFQYEGQ